MHTVAQPIDSCDRPPVAEAVTDLTIDRIFSLVTDPLVIVADVIILPHDTLLAQVERVRDEYFLRTDGHEMPYPLAIECLDQIRYRRGLDRQTARCRCGCHDTSSIPVRLTPVSYWLCCHEYGLSEIIQVVKHIERTGSAQLCPWLDPVDVSYVEAILAAGHPSKYCNTVDIGPVAANIE